jgi:hypothetical protein
VALRREALWSDPELIADARAKASADLPAGERFTRALATRLGLDPSYVITAYEDVPKLLASEAALPVNADPLKADLRSRRAARLAGCCCSRSRSSGGLRAPSASGPEGDDAQPLAKQPVADPARASTPGGDSPLACACPSARCPMCFRGREHDPPVDPFAPRASCLRGPTIEAAAKRAAKDDSRAPKSDQ